MVCTYLLVRAALFGITLLRLCACAVLDPDAADEGHVPDVDGSDDLGTDDDSDDQVRHRR